MTNKKNKQAKKKQQATAAAKATANGDANGAADQWVVLTASIYDIAYSE